MTPSGRNLPKLTFNLFSCAPGYSFYLELLTCAGFRYAASVHTFLTRLFAPLLPTITLRLMSRAVQTNSACVGLTKHTIQRLQPLGYKDFMSKVCLKALLEARGLHPNNFGQSNEMN